MHVIAEHLALIGAVGRDHVLDPVDHDSLAGRTAGVGAVIAVGVIGAVLAEHADFLLAGNDDAPVAVLQVGGFGNKAFGHCEPPRCALIIAPGPVLRAIRQAQIVLAGAVYQSDRKSETWAITLPPFARKSGSPRADNAPDLPPAVGKFAPR